LNGGEFDKPIPFAAGCGSGGYRSGAASMIFSKSPAHDWRFYGATLMFGSVVFTISLLLDWSKQESPWWSLFWCVVGELIGFLIFRRANRSVRRQSN
jgi:hypothetical protein